MAFPFDLRPVLGALTPKGYIGTQEALTLSLKVIWPSPIFPERGPSRNLHPEYVLRDLSPYLLSLISLLIRILDPFSSPLRG